MKFNEIQERVLDSGTLEIRAIEENNERIIEGYAAVYNTRSKLLFNSFYEIIEPGAFDNVLRSEDLDVVFNFNHNNSVVMGRTKNNTLSLRSDQKGLFFRAVLPDTSDAKDLHTLVKDGYISENSFAFMPAKNGYKQERLEDGNDLITIREVAKLRDVSIVTFPAYPNTEVQARAEEEAEREVIEIDKQILMDLIQQLTDLTTPADEDVDEQPEDAPEAPEDAPEDVPEDAPAEDEEEMDDPDQNKTKNKRKFLKLDE